MLAKDAPFAVSIELPNEEVETWEPARMRVTFLWPNYNFAFLYHDHFIRSADKPLHREHMVMRAISSFTQMIAEDLRKAAFAELERIEKINKKETDR